MQQEPEEKDLRRKEWSIVPKSTRYGLKMKMCPGLNDKEVVGALCEIISME